MRTMIAVLFTAFFTSMVYGSPIVIKFSHVVAEDTPKGKMAHRFQELVEDKLSDKVKVEIYPNSQLANDDEVVDKILAGEIQMAAPALSKLKKYTDKLALFDLPFLFTGIGAVDKFNRTDQGKSLLESMEGKGIIGLGYLHNGMKQLSANRPLFSPSDAKGLRFRIMSSDVLVAQFEALGAEPVKKPFREVYKSLKSGDIDGQENTWSNIYSKSFYEVQEYITESNHGYLGYMILTSTEFWNKFDPATRKELEKMLRQAVGFGNQTAIQKGIYDKKKIEDADKAGIIPMKEKEKKKWIKVMKPVWKKFENQLGKELIDAAYASN
uniref:C4-dicarboxylate-binding protein DctP n=1 Tax=Candidatus Kentrum sp. TUN TaxID=2126343 RepID=A0A450ZXM8_9GAMM|nr:MAG: C4-dicarboxylate-binding protein DctP [Candidatus Kentron sp. TUN]VFK58550.1 MAG: C4-dicarboxylate-binding protein DctP [Candidatus Kentron sp. TUN]VFK61052.1 MAG: C4-dicarboxylate-binding protein DctP [Candidatus Kentron sp. TUN]